MAKTLGIDVTEHEVLGVFIESSFRKFSISAAIATPIEPADDEETRLTHTVNAIHQTLASQRRPADTIIAQLDGTELSINSVVLPAGAVKKISDVLQFEMESVLPFDLDDALLDYQITEQTSEKLHLLAASSPKEKIRARIDYFSQIGIEPHKLTAGATTLEGLASLIPQLITDSPIVLVHIDQKTDICILEKGNCIFARTLFEGFKEIGEGQGYQWVSSVRRTIIAARASGLHDPSCIYVSGKSICVNAIISLMNQAFDIPIEQLPLPVLPNIDSTENLIFAKAAALAANSLAKKRLINLRRGEFAIKNSSIGIRPYVGRITVCTIFVLIAFIFSAVVQYRVVNQEHEQLISQLKTKSKSLLGEETADVSRARELLQGRRRVEDPLPRFDAFDVLDMLSEKISPDIRHKTQRLTIEIDDEARDGRFEIQGTVPSITDRDTIASSIDSHECVPGVTPGPITPAPNDEGQNYRLEGLIQCPFETPPIEQENSRRSNQRNTRNSNERR